MNRLLWTLQILLAVMFAFAGIVKLTAPAADLYQMVPLPEVFVRFIAVCEALGAVGLILPSLLRVVPSLTPLAAAGLAIIMTGATALTPVFEPAQAALAALPLALGVMALFIAYGRSRLAPIHPHRTLQLATR